MAETAQSPLTLDMLKTLTFDKVRSVYSGQNGKCCCGCSGKHWSSSSRKVNPDNPHTVSDREVRRVLKVLQSVNPEFVEVGSTYFSTVISGYTSDRMYIVYPLCVDEE